VGHTHTESELIDLIGKFWAVSNNQSRKEYY
jgi:hypothetical protein